MAYSWWLGIGLGLGVIGLHAAARALTHRLALRTSGRRAFLLLELGGLGARMALAFGAVALGIVYVPVHRGTFVVTVLVLLVLSMIVETRLIWRQMERGTLGA